ncbi:MAG: hypothetical protein U0791_12550 [Gemmataceae bacterium]
MLFLLAQQKAAGSPFDRPDFLWGMAGLAAALVAGAIAIVLVDRWRKRAAMTDLLAGEELTDYRGMLERGEITKEEYEKLRLKVARRVKPEEATPANPDAPANPPPPAAGPFPPGYFDDPPPATPK